MAVHPQPAWFTRDLPRACATLTVHVQPGARYSAVDGPHGDALKIRIAAPAVDNKANAALLAFLGETLGVRQSDIRIRRGSRGRRKVIEIANAGEALVARIRTLLETLPH